MDKFMPKSDSWFPGDGKGTKWKTQPISVRFSVDTDAVLRAMSDRQDYIRAAVEAKLRADGLLPDGDDAA